MLILWIILGIIGGLILLVVLYGMTRPRHFEVSRTKVLNAPVEKVFEQVNVMKNWEKWSPWAKWDPNMNPQYHGPESGEGAGYSWNSKHRKVGSGRQTITEAKEFSSILSQLDFGKQGKAQGYWTFNKIDENTTETTWGFRGDAGNNPVARIFGSMMDRMMGPVFLEGLSDLENSANEVTA